ncbi:unnamed protein product [Pocillopora meandrina]|uniref:Zinc finger PHD-type domain-containing protein n=1 Tax=Pocillopora meandrina TaxID=46732 RepID=A0AAU9X188_9CNID|nr:unnamed protein product [Pocillopora meandrina]
MWLSKIQSRRKNAAAKNKQTAARKTKKKGKTNRNEQTDNTHTEDTDDVHCLCMQPWGNRFMIQCDVCGTWHHGSCVGVSEEDADAMPEYYCDMCST